MIGSVVIYTAANGTRFAICEDNRTMFVTRMNVEGSAAEYVAHTLRECAAQIENLSSRFTEVNRDGKTVHRAPRVIPMKNECFALVAHDAVFRRVFSYIDGLDGAAENISFSVEEMCQRLRDDARRIVEAADDVRRAQGIRGITPST